MNEAMDLDSSTKLTVLNDHYNETFRQIQAHLKFRDRLFMYLLIFLGVVMLQTSFPIETGEILSSLINSYANVSLEIDLNFVNVVIWFGLMALVVKYFQTRVYLDRLYSYIHQIEEELEQRA